MTKGKHGFGRGVGDGRSMPLGTGSGEGYGAASGCVECWGSGCTAGGGLWGGDGYGVGFRSLGEMSGYGCRVDPWCGYGEGVGDGRGGYFTPDFWGPLGLEVVK